MAKYQVYLDENYLVIQETQNDGTTTVGLPKAEPAKNISVTKKTDALYYFRDTTTNATIIGGLDFDDLVSDTSGTPYVSESAFVTWIRTNTGKYSPEAAGGGGGAVSSVNGDTGDVELTQDDVPDGTTNKQYSATEKTKLAGISSGATANATDANLRDRSTHTGTQSADTIVDGTTNKAFTATEKTKLSGIATGATNYTDSNARSAAVQSAMTSGTGKAPDADAVTSAIDTAVATALATINSSLSGYIKVVGKRASDGTAHTGNTTETIIDSFAFAANEFAVGNQLDVNTLYKKVGTAGTANIKWYVNTVNNLTGTPQLIAQYLESTAARIVYPMSRVFNIQTGNVIEGVTSAFSAAAEGVSNVANTTATFNPTVAQYFIITGTLSNSGDSIRVGRATLKKA